jgi:hypothetical protein
MSLILEQAILRVIARSNMIGQKRKLREDIYNLRIAWEAEYGPIDHAALSALMNTNGQTLSLW